MDVIEDTEMMDSCDLNADPNLPEEESPSNEKHEHENDKDANLMEDESLSEDISKRFPPPKTYSRVKKTNPAPDPAGIPDSTTSDGPNSDEEEMQEDDPDDDFRKSSTKKKRPARIIDSDSDAEPEQDDNIPSDDDDGLAPSKDLDSEDAEPEPTLKRLNKSRIAKMTDSDSESDVQTNAADELDAEPTFRESRKNSDTQAEPVYKKLQRSKIVDSDSDDDTDKPSSERPDDSDEDEKSKLQSKRQQKSKAFGNVSEDEPETANPFDLLKKELKAQKPPRQKKPKPAKKAIKATALESGDNQDENKKSTIPKLFDSDSDAEPNEVEARLSQEYEKPFASNLIDSDSEEEPLPGTKKGKAKPRKRQPKPKEIKEKALKEPRKTTKKPSKRAPLKSARYVDQESGSESDEGLIESKQKEMYEDIIVNIDHHRPRQCTLKEFLSRKTITLPTVRTDSKRQFKNPAKLTKEELDELARKMEERAQEAAEFFTIKKEKPSSQDIPIVNENPEPNESFDQTAEPVHESVPNVSEEDLNMDSEDVLNVDPSKCETSTANIEEQSELVGNTPTEDQAITEINDENDNQSAAMIAFITGAGETVEQPTTSENQMPVQPKPCAIEIKENIALTAEEVAALLAGENIERVLSTPAESEDMFASLEIEGTEKIPLSEIIKKELPEPLLNMRPRLQGDPDMIIDFDSNEIVPKVKTDKEKFFEKFINHSLSMKNKGRSSVLSILSQSDDPDKAGTPIVILSDEEEIDKSIKKNSSIYLKVKEKLKKRVSLKRREEAIKEYEERQKALEKLHKLEEEEDEEFEDEFDEEMKMELDEEEEATKATEEGEGEENGNKDGDGDGEAEAVEVIDEEGNEGDDEDEEQDEDEEEDEEGNDEEETEENKDGKRTFKRLQLLEDSEDEDAAETKFNDADKNISLNFLNSSVTSEQNVDENELMGLCSGKFDATQKEGYETQKTTVFDAIPQTQMSQEISESQLMALCSGRFTETQIETQSTVEVPDSVIKESGVLDLSSSDEDGNEKETAEKSKKKTKKIKKLKFSDDEEDSAEEIDDNESVLSLEDGENEVDLNDEDIEDVKDLENLEDEEEEVNEHENVETYIDYDSDENEVVVKMTKTDKEKKASEFFEKEAELSDSEWGSADEDERGLDRYDAELGDEDHFDKDKVKADLEKIHLRRLLDQDTRDIKKIEEMLFKTEELDGIGRERKFRWKNIDDNIDWNAPTTEDAEQNNESDEEDDMQWRKLRYERELLLKSQTKQEDDDPSVSLNQTNEDPDNSMKKKIKILQPVKNSPTATNPFAAKFLISKTVQVSKTKGSFLVRGQDTLSRLSTILKSNSETDDGLQMKTAKGGNFVFSRIDPADNTVEKKGAVKRKSEVSADTKENIVKKSKLSLLM